MKSILDEYDVLYQGSGTYPGISFEHLQSIKLTLIMEHIDNIEQTLKYLVDRKVEEKYETI